MTNKIIAEREDFVEKANKNLEDASRNIEMMNKSEKGNGFLSPQDCSVKEHLLTAIDAVKCGLILQDFTTVAEGFIMLNQVKDRIK